MSAHTPIFLDPGYNCFQSMVHLLSDHIFSISSFIPFVNDSSYMVGIDSSQNPYTNDSWYDPKYDAHCVVRMDFLSIHFKQYALFIDLRS